MTNHELYEKLVNEAITKIEMWLRFGCTIEDSFNEWKQNTCSGPKVIKGVSAYYQDLGYKFAQKA